MKYSIVKLLEKIEIQSDGSMTQIFPKWEIDFNDETVNARTLATEWLKNVLAAGGQELRDLFGGRTMMEVQTACSKIGGGIWVKTDVIVLGLTKAIRRDATFIKWFGEPRKDRTTGIKNDSLKFAAWGWAEHIARKLLISRRPGGVKGLPSNAAGSKYDIELSKAEKTEIAAARKAAGGNGGVGDLLKAARKSCRQ